VECFSDWSAISISIIGSALLSSDTTIEPSYYLSFYSLSFDIAFIRYLPLLFGIAVDTRPLLPYLGLVLIYVVMFIIGSILTVYREYIVATSYVGIIIGLPFLFLVLVRTKYDSFAGIISILVLAMLLTFAFESAFRRVADAILDKPR
jgi:hypothetical protein